MLFNISINIDIRIGEETAVTIMRNKLLTGLIAGAAMGAVAGLLFAPKPGKESRQIVVSRSRGIRHKTGGLVDVMRSWRKSKEPVLAGPYEWRSV